MYHLNSCFSPSLDGDSSIAGICGNWNFVFKGIAWSPTRRAGVYCRLIRYMNKWKKWMNEHGVVSDPFCCWENGLTEDTRKRWTSGYNSDPLTLTLGTTHKTQLPFNIPAGDIPPLSLLGKAWSSRDGRASFGRPQLCSVRRLTWMSACVKQSADSSFPSSVGVCHRQHLNNNGAGLGSGRGHFSSSEHR